MGGISDERFVIVGDGGAVDLELGTGMRKKWNMWVSTAVLSLVFICSSVRIHVELGEEGEAIVRGVAVLVSFDVLNGRAECQFV
jgi:hypothetical protein